MLGAKDLSLWMANSNSKVKFRLRTNFKGYW